MTKITVKKILDFPDSKFEVIVTDDITTKHMITVTKKYYEKITGGKISSENLIEKSFEFLLARESNTAILSEFDLPLISKYFPEYEKEITVNP